MRQRVKCAWAYEWRRNAAAGDHQALNATRLISRDISVNQSAASSAIGNRSGEELWREIEKQ